MKRFFTLFVSACMIFAAAACQAEKPVNLGPEASGPKAFAFTKENMPVIDGSTATIPLISAVRSVLLGEEREPDVRVSGTDNAYMKLMEKEADILLVYAPSPQTTEYSQEQKKPMEMAPIGKDALVFLVNVKNPVKSLTEQELVSIYSGEITSWEEVGGENFAITAFQRPTLSGSQTMLEKLVMKGKSMAKAPPEFIISEMGGLVEAVAAYDGGETSIGYNVYYYVSRMKLDENIRLLAVNGVEPSLDTIASGRYPFVNDFYAVIRADAPEGSPERVLFDWIQTDAGQELVRHEGYVPAG